MITDLILRYDHPTFFRGEREGWEVDRGDEPVSALTFHHAAGMYGGVGNMTSLAVQWEIEQLDLLAQHHRTAFGIGPGYHYAVFLSGRAYSIGPWGTHRAHTKGRRPDGVLWNRVALGVVAMGDWDENEPPLPLLAALKEVYDDVTSYAGAVYTGVHGLMPTVNSAGVPYSQETACPGRFLRAALKREELWRPDADNLWQPAPPEPAPEPALQAESVLAAQRRLQDTAHTEGRRAGWEEATSHAAGVLGEGLKGMLESGPPDR